MIEGVNRDEIGRMADDAIYVACSLLPIPRVNMAVTTATTASPTVTISYLQDVSLLCAADVDGTGQDVDAVAAARGAASINPLLGAPIVDVLDAGVALDHAVIVVA